MKFWYHIHNTVPEDGLELAIFAEELGFEGVVGDDHWFMPTGSDSHDPAQRAALPHDTHFPDPLVFGAAVLARTRTLQYGTCVLILANRTNPLLVAKSASTLARLSGDRFILGIGLGWLQDEYEMAGVDWATRVPRTVEMIEILRKLWGPGPVEHHGTFFDFPSTYAHPTPNRPIPIYMGAVAPAALRRTGRIADGWMGMTAKLQDLPTQIALINEGRREADREQQPFEFMVGLARGDDGKSPTADDYLRAQDLGVTRGHFGPADHVLGKTHSTLDEQKRLMEDFAIRVMA